MTLETLHILLPAFAAGVLVFSTHVPLGREVLKRGIIFIDLAIAQIAALGAILAGLLLHEAPFGTQQGLALCCALLGAFFFQHTERRHPQKQEAIIGASFVVASSFAILLVANHPHGNEQIEAMLAGQILWASWKEIFVASIAYGIILLAWFKGKGTRYFYYLFAITVTLSVQLVGIYLVFASLIIPALASASLRGAYAISLVALVAGLLASAYTDLPTGPVLVCVLALTGFISTWLVRPKDQSSERKT